MPTVAGCLCVLLLATYWVAKVFNKFLVFFSLVPQTHHSFHIFLFPFFVQVSFPGLVTCIWLIYGFSFCHFSTVPAQVFFSKQISIFLHSFQAIGLFRHPLNSVVVGTIGKTFSSEHSNTIWLSRSGGHILIRSSWHSQLLDHVQRLGPPHVPLPLSRLGRLQLPGPPCHCLRLLSWSWNKQTGD